MFSVLWDNLANNMKNKFFPWPINKNHLERLISNFVIMYKYIYVCTVLLKRYYLSSPKKAFFSRKYKKLRMYKEES